MERAKVTIRCRGVLEIEGAELSRCRELTYPERSLMRLCIDGLREEASPRAQRSLALLAVDEEQRILGWTLLFENRFGRVESYYFVDPDHRRRGIGRRLAEEVRRLRPRHKVLVRPHDGPSFAFFSNFPKFVPQGAPYWLEELRREAEAIEKGLLCPVPG